MFRVVDRKTALTDLQPLYTDLAADEQDSVRLLAVAVLPEIAKLMTTAQDSRSVVVPELQRFAQDKAWRVRYMLADLITEVEACVAVDLRTEELVPVFVALLQDSEPEIRRCAAGKVFEFCSSLDPATRVGTIVKSIVPCIESISQDDNPHARAALANVVMGLSSVVGGDVCVFQQPSSKGTKKEKGEGLWRWRWRLHVSVCVCVSLCKHFFCFFF